MALKPLDLCLLASTVVIVAADIILALCLRFVLPNHITQTGYYPADGRKVSFDEALRFCPCIARVFPDGTKDLITFAMVQEKVLRRRRQIEAPENLEKQKIYPFLVSLSIPAYSDYPEQKIFACNGLIQSSDSLLTTHACVKSESEWYNLTVRSGSAYWSKLGKEHVVVNVSYLDQDLVALRVFPPFPEAVLPKPPIVYPSTKDWVHAVQIGWDDKMYEKDIRFRYKYKSFDVEEWTSRTCNSEAKRVCFGDDNCKKLSSKPLLTSCHQLVGMKYDEEGDECDKFGGLRLGLGNVTKPNVCYEIQRDTCRVAEMDVC